MSIQPALSEKEWELHHLWAAGKLIGGKLPGGPELPMPKNAHALAARCLHGQPFGFDWTDVDAIRSAVQDTVAAADFLDANAKDTKATKARVAHLKSLADRIAALLPPRK